MTRLVGLTLATVFAFGCAAAGARADDNTGSAHFLRACKGLAAAMASPAIQNSREPSAEDGICLGFIQGAAQAVAYESHTDHEICLPAGSTYGQYTQTWIDYLNNHPDEQSDQTYATFRRAMKASFPCQ